MSLFNEYEFKSVLTDCYKGDRHAIKFNRSDQFMMMTSLSSPTKLD